MNWRSPPLYHVFSPEEEAVLLETIGERFDRRYAAFFRLMFWSGLRTAYAMRLRCRDLTQTRLRTPQGCVPATAAAIAAFRELAAGRQGTELLLPGGRKDGQVGLDHLADKWHRGLILARLRQDGRRKPPPISATRATFAMRLAERGVAEGVVHQLLTLAEFDVEDLPEMMQAIELLDNQPAQHRPIDLAEAHRLLERVLRREPTAKEHERLVRRFGAANSEP